MALKSTVTSAWVIFSPVLFTMESAYSLPISGGLRLWQDINGGPHTFGVLHAEGARLRGHIAVKVLKPNGESMCTIAEVHSLENKECPQ